LPSFYMNNHKFRTTIKLKSTMQLNFSILSIFSFLLVSGFLSAQSSASLELDKPHVLEASEFSIGSDEWTFYLDKENKVYYIDFESISVNLSDLKVFNQDGELVKTDKLWDLPVNTIYELNISDLKPGNYKVELRSYTGIIEKEIQLSE
jgi:methionine-rich copper-binding protein CopC